MLNVATGVVGTAERDRARGGGAGRKRTIAESALLADHTTFHLGGPAGELVVATTERELTDAVRTADAEGTPVLVLGGGSNVLIADEGFPGRVVLVATTGVETRGFVAPTGSATGGESADVPTGVPLRIAAGEVLDDIVGLAVSHGWGGLEALSGIPGLIGAALVQNAGAYGAEIATSVDGVRAWDRRMDSVVTLTVADCGFAYRTSRFKQDPDRYVLLTVDLRLRSGDLSQPVAYPELARRLEAGLGERVPIADVRHAVLDLRAGKGMLVDEHDHDTWSAGSFFTNPVLDAAQADRLPATAPRFPQPDGRVKASAAWLIEQAGFAKGYGTGPARLSTRHVLAITNRGGATTADVLALARQVRDGVERAYGVTLAPEPVLIGCAL